MSKPRIWYIVEFPKEFRFGRYFWQRDSAERFISKVLEKYGVQGKVVKVTESVSKPPKQTMRAKSKPTIITVYRAKDGFRWHMKRAWRIVAESGEGYKRHAACFKSLKNLLKSIEMCDYEFQLPK